MRTRKVWKAVQMLVMIVVAAGLFGEVVMHLWNWLMPSIFGLRQLNFREALGLLVLSKLLLGGFHRHGGGGWGRRGMRAKWEQMTPEERERFRSGLRERGCGFGSRGKKTEVTVS